MKCKIKVEILEIPFINLICRHILSSMTKTNFSSFPTLQTQHLYLRRIELYDDNEILELRSNPQVNKFLERAVAITLEDAQTFIRKIITGIENGEWFYWAITLKDENKLIGTICLWNIIKEKSLAEIGYELHPAHQGKGLMQEAINAIIDFGFNEIQLETITAFPIKENKKSIQVLLRNNFKEDINNEFRTEETPDDYIIYFLAKTKTNSV